MCGVIGLWSNQPAIPDLYHGLLAMQHRGQDSAGVTTFDGRFHTKKGNGLVLDIFTPEAIEHLTGSIGIGHTRYPTIGGGGEEDAQPFQLNSPFGLSMVHNGNVANYDELRDELFEKYHRLTNSDNDIEIILNIFAESLAHERTRTLEKEHIFRAVAKVFEKVKGAYSVVVYIAGQGLVAFRDPYGIKPLVYGIRRDGILPSYAVASESVCLNMMNFGEIKDIKPGEVMFIDNQRNLHKKVVAGPSHHPCLFEWVYFARPDSTMDKVNVYRARVNMGRLLADEIRRRKIPADVVVPIPESARDAAMEISRRLKLKYSEALVKNRYIGRTFIMPAEGKRRDTIRQKLNPIASEIKGKKVLLVDDSIVRGNTSRAIIDMVRECGAKKVYFASASPALRFPCVYGIDMQTKTEFVATDTDEKGVAKKIGADQVIYQNLDDLKKAIRMENPELKHFCAACFDGIYPTGNITRELLDKIEEDRKRAHDRQLELNI